MLEKLVQWSTDRQECGDFGLHGGVSTPGSQIVVPLLHFGGPRMSGSSARSSNWVSASNYYDMADVQSLGFAFAQGFFYCATYGGDLYSTLSIVVATSNSGVGISNETTVRLHGQQWGDMVHSLHSQLKSQSWGNRAWALAGINVEPGFSWNADWSRFWINQARAKNYPLQFVSDPTAFCPISGTYSAGTNCGNGWTAEDIASVSYYSGGGAPIIPIPQIYNSSYVERWYRLSKYSASTSRGKILFRGVMTQWRACEQAPDSSCPTNYPTTAFDSFQSKINSDSVTAYTIPPNMLDIRWANSSNTGAAP